jgi:hypothetical protein
MASDRPIAMSGAVGTLMMCALELPPTVVVNFTYTPPSFV